MYHIMTYRILTSSWYQSGTQIFKVTHTLTWPWVKLYTMSPSCKTDISLALYVTDMNCQDITLASPITWIRWLQTIDPQQTHEPSRYYEKKRDSKITKIKKCFKYDPRHFISGILALNYRNTANQQIWIRKCRIFSFHMRINCYYFIFLKNHFLWEAYDFGSSGGQNN